MIFSKGNNLLFLFILSQAFLSCANQNPEEGRLSPLLDGLGDHYHPISTNVDLAQKYFDQGPEDEEKVYQADLQIFHENGWSLYGLKLSLEMQEKKSEANEVEDRFNKAWAWSDVALKTSRF